MTNTQREQAIELLLCAADWAHRTQVWPYSKAIVALRPSPEVKRIATRAWNREYEAADRDRRYGVPSVIRGRWYVSMHATLLEAATRLRLGQP